MNAPRPVSSVHVHRSAVTTYGLEWVDDHADVLVEAQVTATTDCYGEFDAESFKADHVEAWDIDGLTAAPPVLDDFEALPWPVQVALRRAVLESSRERRW